jgi:hypothetical protein
MPLRLESSLLRNVGIISAAFASIILTVLNLHYRTEDGAPAKHGPEGLPSGSTRKLRFEVVGLGNGI